MSSLFISLFPYFCVLALASIAIIFTERAGIINLGINGVIVAGATTYMIFAYIIAPATKYNNEPMNGWINILLFVLAAIGGMLFSSLHGLISIKLKGNQTISGIALNILAPAITLVILYLFGEANSMNYNVDRLEFGNSKNNELISFFSLKMFITIAVIIVSFIALTFTRWGIRFKSVGENPQAADTAGINVNHVKWSAIMISGAIAGIAGAIYISEFSSGGTFKSQVNVEGLGFLAIAIVIIGRWRTLVASFTAIIFALLFSLGQQANNLFGDKGDNIKSILMMLPYLLTLIVLMILSKPALNLLSKGFSKWSQKSKEKSEDSKLAKSLDLISHKLIAMSNSTNGPKALGEPYDKSKR